MSLFPATQEMNVFLDRADHVVGTAMEDGNFEYAFLYVQQLKALQRASGMGAAKTLHLINLYWDRVEHDEESFLAQAKRITGYSELHIKRLICAWEMISGNYIPQAFRERISEQTLQCLFKEYQLVLLPRPNGGKIEFVEQDYGVTEDDWRELSEAPGEREVADIVAGIKGKPRNKNLTRFVMNLSGDVFVYVGFDSDFLFKLPINDEREFIQNAIVKITERLNMIFRV